MLAKLGNSEPALAQALRDGDVYCIREKGKDYYAWRTLEVERSHGCRQATSMTAPTAELKDEKHVDAMSVFFDTFQGSLGFPASSSAGLPALTMETSKKGPLPFQLSIPCFISFPIYNLCSVLIFNIIIQLLFVFLVLCQKHMIKLEVTHGI